MSALALFDFTGASIRGGEHDGQPVLVGKDVCDALGIVNYRNALAQLDEDERVSLTVDTLGGPQQMTAVTEPGVWSLALISRSPRVKPFMRWLTHEVLPSIRRTGSYEMAAPVALPSARELAALVIAEADRADAAEAKVAELGPKADLADTFLVADGSTRLVREAAKLLGLRERDLRRFLLEEKLVFVRHTLCGNAQYDFYAEFSHHFTVKETLVEHAFGVCSHYTLRVTARGIELIRKRLRAAVPPSTLTAAPT